MQSTKLITLLRTLNDDELKSFSKYLSTLYGKHKASMTLFQHVKKFSSVNYDHKRLDKLYIQEKVLKVKNERRVSNEASQLYEWLNEFLVWNRIKKSDDKIRYQQLLLQEYRERGIEKFVDKTLSTIQEELKETIKQPSDYLYEIEMYHQAYFVRLNEKKDNNNLLFNTGLHRIMEGFKIYQLKYACEALMRRNILDAQFSEMEFIKVDIQSKLGQAYELLYRMLLDENVASFLKVKTFFETNFEGISNQDQRFIMGSMLNWGAKYIRKGKMDLNEVVLKVYLFGLDNKILLEGGFITDMMFTNIVGLAITIKDFELARKVVSDYGHYLSPNDKEVIRLVNAQIYLGEGALKEARKLLEYKYEDVLQEMKNRTMHLCCLYLLEEDFELIDNKCKSFSQFIKRRAGFNKDYEDSVKNFIHILRKLMNKKESCAIIKEEINNCNPIIFKTWLLEQLTNYKAEYA